MVLRTALIGEAIGPSEVLDARVCECCATDAASGAAGPLVAYRDRIGDEVRDVSVVRRDGAGWTTPAVAVSDGWRIAGCPVNGPAIDAAGEAAVVAWFTGAGDAPRVQLAFSADGGATLWPAGGDRRGGAAGTRRRCSRRCRRCRGQLAGAGRRRRLGAPAPGLGAGDLGEPLEIATTGAARASGFPRLARVDDTLYLAWVDTTPADGHRLRASPRLDELPLGRLVAFGSSPLAKCRRSRGHVSDCGRSCSVEARRAAA